MSWKELNSYITIVELTEERNDFRINCQVASYEMKSKDCWKQMIAITCKIYVEVI